MSRYNGSAAVFEEGFSKTKTQTQCAAKLTESRLKKNGRKTYVTHPKACLPVEHLETGDANTTVEWLLNKVDVKLKKKNNRKKNPWSPRRELLGLKPWSADHFRFKWLIRNFLISASLLSTMLSTCELLGADFLRFGAWFINDLLCLEQQRKPD